jgi:DNA-binding transcriptional LysR family regulator
MNYDLIETFLALAKTLNITKAANQLFMSQSTISYRLKVLETELKVSLFDRDKGYKHIELTKHGEKFLKIVQEYERVSDEISNFANLSMFKTVVVGAVDSVNNFVLNNLYKQLLNDPDDDWRVGIKTLHTREIYDSVSFRTIDVGFALSNLQVPYTEAVKVYEDSLFVVSKHNANFQANKIAPSRLDLTNQIYFNWGEEYSKWHSTYFRQPDSPKFKVDSTLLAFQLLSEGYWFFAPSSVCLNMKNLFDFCLYELSIESPVRSVYMVSNTSRISSTNSDIAIFKEKTYDYMYELEKQKTDLKKYIMN